MTVDNVKRCLNVYGKEIAKLKGSMTRKKASKISRMEMLPHPKTLAETHISDMLSMDYLFVQGIPFYQRISRRFKFRTIEALRGKRKLNHNDIPAQSKRAINVYHTRKVTVEQVNADNDFEVLIDELRSIPVNVCVSMQWSEQTDRPVNRQLHTAVTVPALITIRPVRTDAWGNS